MNEEDFCIAMGAHLREEEQEQLQQIVQAFDDVFCPQLGLAMGAVHWIKTSAGQVVQEHRRWLPQGLQKEIKKEIEQMLVKEIIKKSVVQPVGGGTKRRWVFETMC